MASFSDYLYEQTGGTYTTDDMTQNIFSKYYTQWLENDVLSGDGAAWVESQLEGDQLAAFQAGDYHVELNQNDTEGAPYIVFGDGSTYELSGLFEGDKDDFTWTQGRAEQTRYYFDDYSVPQDVNQAPTDIRLNIDPDFAAAVAGAGGSQDSEANTSTGAGVLVVAVLTAADADAGDTHTYELVDDPSGKFEIVGDELILKEGESIDQGEGDFTVTIKVTDSAGNTYFEEFSFTVGADGNTPASEQDTLTGTESGGSGTEADPTVGDDVAFGFAQNDTLNDDGVALTGTSGDDALFGGRGTDTLHGGAGDDQLFGGFNGDTLIGGAGADLLSGGEGDDTFVWMAGDLAGTNGDHPDGSFDTIVDWNEGDELDLSALLDAAGFEDGTDDVADWVSVTNDGTDTVVAVATSEADALAGNYTNVVTILNQTYDSVDDIPIDTTI